MLTTLTFQFWSGATNSKPRDRASKIDEPSSVSEEVEAMAAAPFGTATLELV